MSEKRVADKGHIKIMGEFMEKLNRAEIAAIVYGMELLSDDHRDVSQPLKDAIENWYTAAMIEYKDRAIEYGEFET